MLFDSHLHQKIIIVHHGPSVNFPNVWGGFGLAKWNWIFGQMESTVFQLVLASKRCDQLRRAKLKPFLPQLVGVELKNHSDRCKLFSLATVFFLAKMVLSQNCVVYDPYIIYPWNVLTKATNISKYDFTTQGLTGSSVSRCGAPDSGHSIQLRDANYWWTNIGNSWYGQYFMNYQEFTTPHWRERMVDWIRVNQIEFKDVAHCWW